MRSLRRVAAIGVILFAIIIVIILTALKDAVQRARVQILPAYSKGVMNEYQPKTGDILMMHYLGHGMIGLPVAEHWPTHAALVWVRPNKSVVVLECTKFSAPALPNILPQTKEKEHGVRAVEWSEYVNAIDNVLYIRQIESGTIKSEDVEREVNNWAIELDFEPRIQETMTVDLTIAIGFVTVWPQIADWCARAGQLHDTDRRKTRSFCSEFVSNMLQRVGCTDSDFKDHFSMGPASFLKSVGKFDSLWKPGFSWGEDRMLVRRY